MLNDLKPAPGSRPSKKRVARGNSAGGGTTAGRGTKGQQARSGAKRRFGFEGGQVPLVQRQPKLGGFNNPNRIEYEILNLADLEENLEAGTYDAEALRAKNMLSTKRPVKILGNGVVTKKFELTVHGASKSAKEAIAKAGGSLKVV